MGSRFLIWGFSFLFLTGNIQASFLVKQYRRGEEIKIISVSEYSQSTDGYTLLKSIPYILSEGPESSQFVYEEIIFENQDALPDDYREFYEANHLRVPEAPEGAELKTIIQQGPPKNRINLTIVGDGYTNDEKDKFFQDAGRISQDLFKAQAFSSYLPLFNIFAVFVPSNDSGISDLEKKDTAFGLYRSPPGSKRAIMPGNTAAIERALSVAPATDFPIVIANDDFYGGLGGRYAISTRSVLSGSVVLRHELGHNFGDVGEEYDGGYVYRGANFSSRKNFRWANWADGDVQVYDSKFISGEYVWQNLHNHPFKTRIEVPAPSEAGPYQLFIRLSGVGWTSPGDVNAFIDGNPITFEGLYTPDRSFFDVKPLLSLSPGSHNLEVKEMTEDENKVLAFAQVTANRPDYDYTPNKIAAFATFDDSGNFVGYRPTDDSCLMRNMRSPFFCAIDKENMWIRFLNRVDLIDSVEIEAGRKVQLKAAPLKDLSVHWFKLENGEETELEELRDKREWNGEQATGKFRVRVEFKTPEVRTYTKRFTSLREFQL
ncbi:MAG: hypothetical protein JWQ35_2033 [Bacteriovoracaceae bacterium]|nr:hypothetical protein [Bacteriovoracaceae bacterium]